MANNDLDRRICALERMKPEDWSNVLDELLLNETEKSDSRRTAYLIRINYDLAGVSHDYSATPP